MSAHSKLSSLYLHAGSFVPSQHALEDPRLTHFAGALSEPVVHLDRLERERRATAPAGKPRRRSKLDEAIERADASFVRLSVTELVSSPYSAPFTLGDEHDAHEARRAGRASLASNLSAAPTTTSPPTPRTPLESTKTPTKTFAHAAPYLHDDPVGISKVSPHFHHADERHELHTRPTLPAWARSAPHKHQPKSASADHTRAAMRIAAKPSTRATTEQLADLKLRDECIAMRRAEASRPVRPAAKKPSRLASLLEAVKNKTTSRILTVKRALHTRGGFR